MPGDIASPHDLRFARPKTSPAVQPQRNGGSGARPGTSGGGGGEDYHVELLEYEWPDLPPIPQMKDAITRERVSKGISYILPIDKSKISINNHYRTDLRAMFQEPYASDKLKFDENKLKLSAKIHFDTNTGDTKWTKTLLKSVPVEINSESEKIRRLYARSAPAGGSRKRSDFDLDQMKTRSNLFLPMKTRAHPEAMKLRKEVEKIINSVQEDGEDYDDDRFKQSGDDVSTAKATLARPSLAPHMTRDSVVSCDSVFGKPRLKLTADKFSSYEQLQKTKPPKPVIPDLLKSRFLSTEKNQSIWDWLHHGEEMTEFEFFLSVCG